MLVFVLYFSISILWCTYLSLSSIYPFIHPSTHPSIQPSTCPFTHHSVYPLVCHLCYLSIYHQSIFLTLTVFYLHHLLFIDVLIYWCLLGNIWNIILVVKYFMSKVKSLTCVPLIYAWRSLLYISALTLGSELPHKTFHLTTVPWWYPMVPWGVCMLILLRAL
jgi:hypothetical protein